MKKVLILRPFVSIFLLTLLTTFSCVSFAGADNQKRVFRFNISPNGYPPYLIVEGSKPSGIIWDVVNLIAPRLGYKVKPVKIPRKRVDMMLADGYIDGTPRAIEWTKDQEKFLFTNPVVHVEEVFFFRKNSDLEYKHPSDLFGKTIVTPLGYFHPLLEPYFKDNRIKRFDVASDKEMFTFMMHGEQFHGALADRLVGQWILKKEGLTGRFRSSAEGVSQFGLRIMLRKDWEAFSDAFNQELAAIRENGELDAILAKYR